MCTSLIIFNDDLSLDIATTILRFFAIEQATTNISATYSQKTLAVVSNKLGDITDFQQLLINYHLNYEYKIIFDTVKLEYEFSDILTPVLDL